MPKDQSKDLEYRPLKDLSWTPEQRIVSLDKVFNYVSTEAQQAISWYLNKKRSKRIWAQLLRLGAILATTIAAIIPLLAEIFVSDGKSAISPAWASVALILAVALIGLDRFFGFSSAWMRFLTTELKIRNALQLFQMNWEMQKASWKGAADPTDEQIQDMLARCKAFLVQINNFLEDEMAAWVREFQTALKQIDEAAKARAETTK